MVLLAGAGLVGAQAVQCEVGVQPQGVEGLLMGRLNVLLDVLQSDAAHTADRVGEVLVNDFLAENTVYLLMTALIRNWKNT